MAVAVALAVQSSNSNVSAPLKPSGPWNVEYAENMCLLSRPFGDDDRQVTLGFKPGPASDSMRLILLTRRPANETILGIARVKLDDKPEVSGGFIAGPVRDRDAQIIAIDLKRSELAPLGKAKVIRVHSKPLNVELEASQLGAAIDALKACENDLLAGWGMDPAAVASIADFPRIDRAKGAAAFFSTNDYPEDALRRNEQGTTGARVHVSADGRVTDCKVIESSGSVSIDAQTCSIIRARFRFEPARTAAGQAVPSFTYQRIRWEMPWH